MQAPLTNQTIALRIEAGAKQIHRNFVSATLSGMAQHVGEVEATPHGTLVARTGKFTGRSPKDKYIVRDATTEKTVWWDNAAAMTTDQFDALLTDMLADLGGRTLHQQQLFAGADPAHRFDVEVFTPNAWHALFIRHLLIRPAGTDLDGFKSNVTVVHVPDFQADPQRHGTRTDTCIALDMTRNIILICGTQYAGEIKKSVFSLFNFHAPDNGVLPMHCSANLGEAGDTTLFFGLSGTGKTTLSASAHRALIGDDEHGWSDNGVFNLEGGCYAKAINLSAEGEPEIYAASRMRDVIMENVILDETGEPDFTDVSLTENTRIAYPLTAIPHRVDDGQGPKPKNIVLLTADAFGVLPPLAKLTTEQAIHYFISGYTAKVAGTERGVTEPQATFSACFGAPFMARHPSAYGALLADRLAQSGAKCWLLNTGWTGGAYGVGKRMALKDTRRMLEAALSGELDEAEFHRDEIFALDVPVAVEGVDPGVFVPRKAWADEVAYEKQATALVKMFDDNMQKLGISISDLLPDALLKSDAA